MSDSSIDTNARGRSRSVPLSVLAVLGLVLAGGILVFMGFIAPDNGFDASSLQRGIGLAAAVAAVPVATLLRPVEPSRGVALGER